MYHNKFSNRLIIDSVSFNKNIFDNVLTSLLITTTLFLVESNNINLIYFIQEKLVILKIIAGVN